MTVFTSSEFINKLKWLVNDVPNYYYSKSGTWCNYNKENGKFMMDCVVSIKGLLWNFKADKTKPHGGGTYGANGVKDFGANSGIDYCKEVSKDFNNLNVGEYLCMKDTKYNHCGICIEPPTKEKRGKVFECTVTWNTNKCIISEIDTLGNRYYNNIKAEAKWTYHGKLIYINYINIDPEPINTFLPPRGYFTIGDTSPNIGKIATFMRRVFPLYTSPKALGNYYGKYIQASIKDFQRRTGIPVTGNVDNNTLTKLKEYGFKE